MMPMTLRGFAPDSRPFDHRVAPSHRATPGSMMKNWLTPHLADDFASHWRADLTAGFLVSLIALPLCLGIATASGFPPIAGVISAVVGGLLVSRINGAPLGITGPATGLITVLLAAVQSLGEGDVWAGYRYTLAAGVVAGGLQIFLGWTRMSRIAALFPAAIAHGMLAAIGISIMVRQMPLLLGTRPETPTVWQALLQVPESLFHFNPLILLVGLSSLAILFAWPLLGQHGLGRLPAPMVAVLASVTLGRVFDLNAAELFVRATEGSGLLNPPVMTTAPQFLADLPDRWLDSLVFPAFGKIGTAAFWSAVAGLFLVGSLESLLVASAVNRLTPGARRVDLNRDMTAIGVGNILSSLIGGLPMITEIVRSSANIGYGAQSANANFFHGLFLALFIVLIPNGLEHIPLATLAALLIYAGYRLASPATFRRAWDVGSEQLGLFVLTLVAVLATDILTGVAIALAAKLLLSRWLGGRQVTLGGLFRLSYGIDREPGGPTRIHIDGPAVFSNFLPLKNALNGLPAGERVVIDVSRVQLIDHTVMDFIERFRESHVAAGGDCTIIGLESLSARSEHPLATRVSDQTSPGTSKP